MNFGLPDGIKITALSAESKTYLFRNNRYGYDYYSNLVAGTEIKLPHNCTIVMIKGSGEVAGQFISQEKYLHKNNSAKLLIVRTNGAEFVVAAPTLSSPGEKDLMIQELGDAKTVRKPWGYEVWINGENSEYSLKKILLNKGCRTSLQFHRKKRETNLVLVGEFEFTFLKDSNETFSEHTHPETISILLSGPVAIDIEPMNLHRISALSDLIMYEASSPELDDVIRVSDDNKRGNGRISSEH